MRVYEIELAGVPHLVEMHGGDESDYDKADEIIHSNTHMKAADLARKVHIEIAAEWHDPNGFMISIDARVAPQQD